MELGAEGLKVLAVTLVFLVLVVQGRVGYGALGLGLVVLLPLTGVVDAGAALAGFSNKAVLTIAGLYVVGAGLTRTGALDLLGRALTRAGGGSETRTVLLTGLAAAVLSAFVNDTAVVVVFLPILLRLGRQTGIPASRLLMPLAFASLLGGMCTLIGTSTNLLVSGMAEELGAEPLRMFDLAPVGVPMALVCILFLAVVSRRLLPARASLTEMLLETPSREYVTELEIGPDSPLAGREVPALGAEVGAELLFLVRDGAMIPAASFAEPLRSGDVLILRGGVEEILRLQETSRLEGLHGSSLDPHTMEMFELALAPGSTSVGQRVRELDLSGHFGLHVMAVLRGRHHLHERVADLRLRPGDVLLVCGDADSRRRVQGSGDFFLLAGPTRRPVRRRARRALAVAGTAVLLLALGSVFGWKALPTSSAALIGALGMVAAGCLDTRQAFRSIDWPVLVFLAGTLALGEAMRVSGVAAWAADSMVRLLHGGGPPAVVAGLVALGFGFNFLVSHSAVVVLFTPVAVAAAGRLALDAGHEPGTPEALAIQKALLLAVCYGGSMCFATPVAHQVNLMVLGPGGYRYADFLRLGLPVSLLAGTVAALGIPRVTGLL